MWVLAAVKQTNKLTQQKWVNILAAVKAKRIKKQPAIAQSRIKSSQTLNIYTLLTHTPGHGLLHDFCPHPDLQTHDSTTRPTRGNLHLMLYITVSLDAAWSHLPPPPVCVGCHPLHCQTCSPATAHPTSVWSGCWVAPGCQWSDWWAGPARPGQRRSRRPWGRCTTLGSVCLDYYLERKDSINIKQYNKKLKMQTEAKESSLEERK